MARARVKSDTATKQSIFNRVLATNDVRLVANMVREFTDNYPLRMLCVEQASHIVAVLETVEGYDELIRLTASRLDRKTIDNPLLYDRMPKSLQSLVTI